MIILTSLAPSPIAKVTFFGYLNLIKFTISAFCFGETRHANTTSAKSVAPTKISLKISLAIISVSVAPPTIIAYFFCEPKFYFILDNKSFKAGFSSCSVSS